MRINLSKSPKKFPLPSLDQAQKSSYQDFLERGISEVFDEIGPFIDPSERGWVLSFSNPMVDVNKPNISLKDAILKGKNYDAPLFITATLEDPIRRLSNKQNIYLGDLPIMTSKGTFIINGNEKIVQHLLVRAEGVYFNIDDSRPGMILGGAEIRTKVGSWVTFETSRTGVISVKIDRKRKFTATTLLRVFGLETDEEIRKAFSKVDVNPEVSYIENTLVKDVSKAKEEAVM